MKRIFIPLVLCMRAHEGLDVYHRTWLINQEFRKRLSELTDELRRIGFEILNFETLKSPTFDPYCVDEMERYLIEAADLILSIREQNSRGVTSELIPFIRKCGKPIFEFVHEMENFPCREKITGVSYTPVVYQDFSEVARYLQKVVANAA